MRVQRAWEVLTATGRGLSDWHRALRPPLVPADTATCLVVSPEIPLLNKRIERRFHQMLEAGALDECRRFLQAGYDPEAPAGRVLGARPLIEYLRGSTSLDVAIAAAVTATRQFAKRQRTWLRRRMADWSWVDPAGDWPSSI